MNPQQQFWPIADTRFPWLTREQVSRLEQVTSNFTWLQKLQKQQELYQQAIKQIQANKNQEDRVAAENEKYCRSLSKDTKEMTTDQCSVRLEQLADTVKNYYGLNPNVDTNTIVDWLVKLNKQKKVDNELLNKYLDSWDKEYLYQMGFEKRPEEWNNIDYLKIASAIYNPVWTLANEAWKYFGEHPAEITVWAAQSPWKWWYNLIWQWIDRAWKSLAWKLEWTDLANFVKQSAIDLFWEDEVRKYAEQKQQELKNWTAFNGRTQTDIRTPLLWDKADTTATQIWETIWDIWTAIALSYPMAAATSSYMWAANATQAARSILLWSTQWAADMAAYELWANNEMASPTEMAVWWAIWAAAPLVVPMFSAISKGVSSKYWEIMNTIRTANKWKLRSELVDLFSRWVKPSSAWVKSTAAQEKIYDDAMDAVETIIWNKNNLRYVTQDWEEIYWKLPTNTREFAQALEQSKRDVYNQYNAITNWAWERIEISTDWLIDELLKLKNDKAAMLWNEWLENAIDSWLNWLKEVKSLTPAQVQRKMQEINKKLEAFYKNPNPNDVSWNSVDALVKNWLSKEMDDAIESALWSSAQYEELKRAYASLKTIEKDVNHRAIVSWRQSPNSLVDSIADISSAENIIDMLTNPTAWLKVLWKQALKKYIKSSNSSDNMVKKLFEKAEKELERSWTLKTRQQILKQQQQEYERWLNQWADKNYLPFIEWADDAWKTVIPWGEKIAVTPEWYAVREWKIWELPTENINYVDNAVEDTTETAWKTMKENIPENKLILSDAEMNEIKNWTLNDNAANQLVALHNLSKENLEKAAKLWWFPMPSIAVTKKWVPHDAYWDISIVFKKETVDPAASKSNKLYWVDAWTPTFPNVKAIPKDTAEADKILNKIEKETWLSYWELSQWMEYRDVYERDYPILKNYADDFDKLVDYKIFDWFTPSWKRKYLDYNLDNVVKYMKKQDETSPFGNFGKLVWAEKGKLKNIDDARWMTFEATDKEAFNNLSKEYSDAMYDVYSNLEWKNSYLDFGSFSNIIESTFNKNTKKWLEKAKYELMESWKNLTVEDLEKIHKPIKEGANLKRPFAESKPERAVTFDEVNYVLAPEEQAAEVEKLLWDKVQVVPYKSSEWRSSKLQELQEKYGNVFFWIGWSIFPISYLLGYNSWNLESEWIES